MAKNDVYATYPSLRDGIVIVDQIVRKFGTVDVLVNNAGNDTRRSIAEVTSASWDQMIAINLKHQFFMAQAVIPAMQKAQRGSVINMRSIGWVIPSIQLPVYVTAKAATVGMTRTLAHELGNQALRRMLLAEEVARLVLFLAADDSAAITNQSYVIDGGWVRVDQPF